MSQDTILDPEQDEIIDSITEAADFLDEQVGESEEHGLLIVGAKMLIKDNPDDSSVQTFVSVSGYYDIIEEGLFADLMAQIEDGQMALFAMLRNVVRDIESAQGIDPNDEIGDENATPTYH